MAKRMTSGDLRETIALQTATRALVSGEETLTWATVAGDDAVRAEIRYEREYERIRAGRTEANQSIVVTIRKDHTVTPEHRILWRGDTYEVEGQPRFVDDRRMWIRFEAVITDAK